jgi:hypothetical protein
MIYQVQATIVHHTTDRIGLSVSATKQIPTFFLNGQGILNKDHAEKTAREIICPLELEYESITVNVNVVEISLAEHFILIRYPESGTS